MSRVRRILSIPWVAYLAALAGGLVYAANAFFVARTKTSFLDEGLYLYKGWLFATGVYQPYQDYGVWTNHLPFVFLIPGYIQKWFGPGLETGRTFMIFLGLTTSLGLWILARRWGGNWWAAAIVWALALNPAQIKVYTLAISEGLIAPMMVWMLVLILGVKRPTWQIMLAVLISVVMMMTRVNLAFVPPILVFFIIWRYGWKTGIQAGLLGIAALIIFHIPFWPNILKAWAWWLPKSLTPFLAPWRIPASAFGIAPLPDETSNPFTIFLYISLVFRLYFVALVSALGVWLLWPRRTRPLTERIRASVFLSVLLLVLFIAHMQYAFSSACVSCIQLYTANFDFLGLLLIVVSYRFLARELPAWRRLVMFSAGALLIFSVGFSTYEDVNSAFANAMIDRMDRFYPWNVLRHFVQIQPLMLFRQTFVILLSLLTIALFALVLFIIARRLPDRKTASRRIGLTALNLLLASALLLSPTIVLGKGNDFFDCGNTNVLQSYKEAGDYLASAIPPGSKIYWDGRLAAIFLYTPGVFVYPPQLNHVHSYYTGGNADILYRFSHWNDALARQWIREADFILLQKEFEQDWEIQIVSGAGYKRLDSTPKLEKCRWQSVIDVYQRIKP
ncbi:MAG: hypothetical protein HYR70_09480 [Chloroflexi bacterium]|nr:hypothetical protein [Chloroflexota bacterium]MBI3338938.1 hypothetical protein [Chloroflexota bacterium]